MIDLKHHRRTRPPPQRPGAARALGDAREDLQQNFRRRCRPASAKLDLVTREEFDVQRAVLLRTREKLDVLEQQVAALEARSRG